MKGMVVATSNKELEATLARTPLFGQTSSKQRKALAKAGKLLTWAEGKTGVEEGSKAAAFFLILEGAVDVDKGGTPVARLRDGDFFGETALLSGGARTASVTATTETQLFALGRPAFRSLVQNDPSLALAIMKAMAERASAGD